MNDIFPSGFHDFRGLSGAIRIRDLSGCHRAFRRKLFFEYFGKSEAAALAEAVGHDIGCEVSIYPATALFAAQAPRS